MPYFRETGTNLFCQDFMIQEAMRYTNKFLPELDKVVDFENMWRDRLTKTYKGKCTLGPPAYAPQIILKMLFLSYLFNVSEREIERTVNDSISMKTFLGIALTEPAPDHSTLTKFKQRILDHQSRMNAKEDLFREMFDEIILLAQEKGIELGFTQVIDSTHTIADVNTKKDQKRQKKKSENGEGKLPRDPDAKWGVKRVKEIKTAEGKKVKVKESYFGYKSHFSGNAKTNLITSYKVTPMNGCDTHQFQPLMKADLAKGVAKAKKTIYAADRAYDDGENHAWLNQEKLKDAISLKYVKEAEKFKDENGKEKVKARWQVYTTQEEFEEGQSQRYAIERMNAGCKKHHGLDRAKYLGIKKMNIQTALTAMAHNLKTLVKLLTGTGFKAPALAHVS